MQSMAIRRGSSGRFLSLLSHQRNYWTVENMGAVTAKIDEQKTDETKQKIQELVGRL